MDRLCIATDFAAEKHKYQRRKDSDGTPYINHPIGVAKLISTVGQISDPDILIAGLLHDTVEDTKTTFEEIEEQFGQNVADIVKEVTDDKNLPKVERKRLQVINAPKKSVGAKIVKLADKLYNMRDLLTNHPPGWSAEYIQGSFVWVYFIVSGMRGTNPGLEAELDKLFHSQFMLDGILYNTMPSFDQDTLDGWLDRYYKLCE